MSTARTVPRTPDVLRCGRFGSDRSGGVPMRTWHRLGWCALLLGLVAVAAPADAVTTSGYAQWDPLAGTANNYSSGWQVAVPGFPRATMTSDSRAGSVGVQSGASTWFGENTPVGLAYGSSRNPPYMSLRPN